MRSGTGSNFPVVKTKTKLLKGSTYRLVARGRIEWFSPTTPVGVDYLDALYCWGSTNPAFGPGCGVHRLGPRDFLHLEHGSFKGPLDLIDNPKDTSPGGRLPYNGELNHEYTVTFKARSTGKLRASAGYTNVANRTGAFTLELRGKRGEEEETGGKLWGAAQAEGWAAAQAERGRSRE